MLRFNQERALGMAISLWLNTASSCTDLSLASSEPWKTIMHLACPGAPALLPVYQSSSLLWVPSSSLALGLESSWPQNFARLFFFLLLFRGFSLKVTYLEIGLLTHHLHHTLSHHFIFIIKFVSAEYLLLIVLITVITVINCYYCSPA